MNTFIKINNAVNNFVWDIPSIVLILGVGRPRALFSGSGYPLSSACAPSLPKSCWLSASMLICTLTSLVILTSGVEVNYGVAAGAELTISGFVASYGKFASVLSAFVLCCFAFFTILGWGLYGQRCVEFLLGTKISRVFLIVYSLVSIVGATMDLGIIWKVADTFNALMCIPNLIALALLSPVLTKLVLEKYPLKKK